MNEPEKRTKWLRVNPAPKRLTHPALYFRTMVCQRIEQITRSDHGTYLVLVQRDSEEVEYVTLDCLSIFEIAPCKDRPEMIAFVFEAYFSEVDRAKLHMAFLRGEYDDLGDVVES